MKKKTIKIIAVIIAAVMLVVCGMIAVFAEPISGSCGTNVTWEYDSDTQTLTISGTGPMASYSTNGSITTAPWSAYYNKIDSVFINSGVTSIGWSAFCGCTGLTSTTIPDGVTSIGVNAFSDCTGLTSITIPDSVTSIGNGAFHGCTGLTSITIPDSVTSIGDYAFSGCSGLTSITIPGSVTVIKEGAFSECTGLTSITIPNGVKKISDFAFEQCHKLKSVSISEGVTEIGRFAFLNCGITSVTIPESLKKMGAGAFINCMSLETIEYNAVNCILNTCDGDYINPFWFCLTKSITIGKNVETVPAFMLGGIVTINYQAVDVTLLNNNTQLNSNCFVAEYGGYEDEYLADANQSFSDNSTEWSEIFGVDLSDYQEFSYAEINIVNKQCGDDLYWDYDESTQALTITGTGDMYNYSGNAPWNDFKEDIKSISISNSATSIGDYAFNGCTGLASITIPENIISIGNRAFAGCTELTSIIIPENVKSIGSYAFSGSGIVNLYYNAINCTTSSFNWVFNGSPVKNVIIGSGVESIPYNLVSGCTSHETVTIPSSVKTIYGNAFSPSEKIYYDGTIADWCAIDFINEGSNPICDLSHLYISGQEVTKITENDLQGVTSIGDYAFNNLRALKTVTIPEGVTRIGEKAFCFSGITDITIPKSLKKIGSSAFERCFALRTINYNAKNCQLEYATTNNGQYYINPFWLCFVENIIIGKDVEDIPIYVLGGIITVDYSPVNVILLNHNLSLNSNCFFPCYLWEDTDEYIEMINQSITQSSLDEIEETFGIDFSDYQKLTYAEANVIKENHTFDDGVVTKEASCKEEGEIRYTCTECGYSYTETIPKTDDHDWNIFTITPDCTQEGGKLYVCKRCGHSKLEDVSPALGHDYAAKVTPATCETDGYTTYTCSRCGNNYVDDEVTATGHNYEPFEIRTTCIQDGCVLSICSNCGRAQKSDVVPATGHSFGDWTVVKQATETEEGLSQRRCSKCGYTEDKLISRLDRTTYTATFVADGKTVATVEFLKGATSVEEPAVPNKDRYDGKWTSYTLADSDITINAEYTLIDLDTLSGIESGKSASYNSVTGEATVNIYAASEGKTVVSTTSEKVPLDIVLVVDQSGSMADKLGGSKTKQQALKTAATDFVNAVYADASENSVDHRIAIVGFGMGSQSAQGYSAYGNTEILTTGGNPVQYNNATANDYATALMPVNNGGVNAGITSAIANIDAYGATAADYGLSMANSIFANTDGEGRQRIVVFMTDGAPTYRSDFSKDVANAAVLQANQLKNTYGASVYSVGVMSSSEAANSNIDRFMNYVSSNYAEAENINKNYTKHNDSYYIPVNNTNALSGVFTEIVTENITRTTDFDNITVIDTISKYFTLTEKQEKALRISAIETYGVRNSDITVTRNEDGTTTVIIRNLHPIDNGTRFAVNLSFKVSANENALKAGTYSTNTEDAGIIIGDSENYECVLDAPSITIPADRTISVFKVNGEIYEIKTGANINIPETDFIGEYEFTGWNLDSGIEVAEGVTEYDAVYVSKQDYIIVWNTDESTQRETYTPGQVIDEPEVGLDSDGNAFRRWNGEVPTTMPAQTLEFTAVYGDHEHHYDAEIITPVTCLENGTVKYTCSVCGKTYTETVVCPGEHTWVAVAGSAGGETGYEEFECEVCGEHSRRTLEYTVIGTNENAGGGYDSITTELNYVDTNGSNTQPDGDVNIVVPVSDYFDGAENVDVYRVDGDGNRTQCDSEYDHGLLFFWTNHFSTYELVATYSSTGPCEHIDADGNGACDNCGEPITYTKDIIVDGNKIGEVTFTYGDTELTNLPAVPAKPGYTGEWEYNINGSELDIHPKYTLITYYATFMADGKQVSDKVPFTVESTSLDEPAVPEKEGFDGKWDSYTIVARNITIIAIYTEKAHEHSYVASVTDPTCTKGGYTTYTCSCGDSYVADDKPALGHSFTNYVYNNDATTEKDGTETAKCDRCDATDTRTKPGTKLDPETPVNPTANAKLNVKASQTVDYKANVTVTATADNVPEGYVLAIYEGNTLREKGDNTKVSYKVGTMTATKTFTVKVIDANKNVQKDANGNDLAANCEVKVKSGFFDKLIAFFKGLFGALPNVEVKP